MITQAFVCSRCMMVTVKCYFFKNEEFPNINYEVHTAFSDWEHGAYKLWSEYNSLRQCEPCLLLKNKQKKWIQSSWSSLDICLFLFTLI